MQNFKTRFATLTSAALMLVPLATNARVSHAQEPAPVTNPVTQKPNALDKFVFLPLMAKPLPVTSVTNGNFESGATGWAEHSSAGVYPRIRTTFTGSVTPHGGGYAAWLGGSKNDTSYVQQQISVSNGGAVLGYWQWIASSDVCNYDKASVLVNGNAIETYNLCDDTDTKGWVKHTVNLSAFIGQSASLRIQVTTDGTLNSNLFIDDIAFQSAPTMAQSQPAMAGGTPLNGNSQASAPMPEAGEANTPASTDSNK
jgi:hypothetical protein